MTIAGTKSDIEDKAQVSKKEVEEFCKSENCFFDWISTKDIRDVDRVVVDMMTTICDRDAIKTVEPKRPTNPRIKCLLM